MGMISLTVLTKDDIIRAQHVFGDSAKGRGFPSQLNHIIFALVCPPKDQSLTFPPLFEKQHLQGCKCKIDKIF